MIYLRPYKKEDAERLTEIKRKKEVQVFGSNVNLTAKEFDKNVQLASANKKLGLDYSDFYTICIKEKNKEVIVGSYVLRVHTKRNDADVGIFIDPMHQGKGYATQAHMTGIFIAKKLKLKKLIGETDHDNIASQKSLMKAGYKFIKKYTKYKIEICRYEYQL